MGKLCPNCQTDNYDDAQICINCGSDLEASSLEEVYVENTASTSYESFVKVCPHCGFRNENDGRFCSSCGKNMGTTSKDAKVVVPYNVPNNPRPLGSMSTVLMIFWVIFIGIWVAIENVLLVAAYFVSIIGIPLGVIYFKSLPLVLNPVGKRVVTHYMSHPIGNTFALIFGGLINFIALMLIAVVCAITIIGIPLSIQISKIATFFLAPFGCEIIRDGTFTQKRDTNYDLYVFLQSSLEHPNHKIQYDDGTELGLKEAIKHHTGIKEKIEKHVKKKKMFIYAFIFIAFLVVAVVGIALSNMPFGKEGFDTFIIYYIIEGGLFLGIMCIGIVVSILRSIDIKFFHSIVLELIPTYPAPDKSPYTSSGGIRKEVRDELKYYLNFNRLYNEITT